jgi:hypothetical protein
MFSSRYSGELHPHREAVVAEAEVVAEVEVEVGEVEDLLADRIQPSNQWHQPLTSVPWEKNPKTSTGTERKPTILLKK